VVGSASGENRLEIRVVGLGEEFGELRDDSVVGVEAAEGCESATWAS
jgi:hypothetical protein